MAMAGERGGALSLDRVVSGAVTSEVLSLVRVREGDDGVARLLELAGERRSVAELEDLTDWSSYEQGRCLLEAAGEVLGGSHHLREVAQHWVRAGAAGDVAAVLQSLGSPEALLEAMPEVVSKFSTVTPMETVEVREGGGVVAAWPIEGAPRYREVCDYTAGALGIVPLIFGLGPAEVREVACVLDGSDRCVFDVRWAAHTSSEAAAEALRGELAAVNARFDSFRRTVASLVAGGDLDELLRRIVDQASGAVRAPAHLLAIRMGSGAPLVHSVGLTSGEAELLADDVLTGDPDDGAGSRLVVDVTSDGRRHGRLVALFPPGSRFLEADRSLLADYADLAAAAIAQAAALESTRRDALTATALLDLACTLAETTDGVEVAEALVEAVTEVIDCDRVAVYLFDRETALLQPVSFRGFPAEHEAFLRKVTISADDTPLFEQMLTMPEPLCFTADVDDPWVGAMMQATGLEAVVVNPLVSAERFYGVSAAGVVERPERLEPTPELLARFRALADQSATALRNVELVAHIQHQALHDGLTGLPNRALYEDRVELALQRARRTGHEVAVLFVDLDDFKKVNDTYGHRGGDEVLCLVGERLRGCLRASDTVARLGGDEFVVLVADSPNGAGMAAEAVAAKVLDALRMPFAVDGGEVVVSGSIGIATSIGGDQDRAALLHAADDAMYAAKAAGNGRWAVAGS
ncbi:MAG TPA: diguanylate cyclase [Acidimicrobiales bacterium]|nr:diguanylate cyclase [Acidimicrobiales bacterium]